MKNLLARCVTPFPRASVLHLATSIRHAACSLPSGKANRAHAVGGFGISIAIVVGIVGVLFITTACIGEVTPPQQTSVGATESSNGVTLRRSALVRAMSTEDLSRESAIVAVGTIREVSAGRWSTPDGKRPAGTLRGGPDAPIIFREALLQVEEYIKGSFGAKELTIHLEGGQAGADNMWVEDQVSLEPGEKVLVFLSPDTSPELAGRPGYAVRGSFQGKYKISDGLAVGGGTNSSIPLTNLTARIKSAMAN